MGRFMPFAWMLCGMALLMLIERRPLGIEVLKAQCIIDEAYGN